MANNGMILGVLTGIVLFLVFVFCFFTCCVVRCFRPQRSPGPAWWPNVLGQRRVVNKWGDKKGFATKLMEVDNINEERFHASYGNIRGMGYNYKEYVQGDQAADPKAVQRAANPDQGLAI